MKSAVVTGAGSGIGAAVARRLLADGWAVVAVDNQRNGLAQYAENHEVCNRPRRRRRSVHPCPSG